MNVKSVHWLSFAKSVDTIPRIMEDAVKDDCAQSDLILNVKKSTPNLKSGEEFPKSVNLVDVEWNEEVTDTHEVLEVKLHLRSKDCIANASDCDC